MEEDRLSAAKKRCLSCGEMTELLRFRCPNCGLEHFDAGAAGDYELVAAMEGCQRLSLQHVDQGGRLFQQGAVDEALQEFQRAIDADPWNATAHGNIGVILLRRGQPRDALNWFERALEIDPRVPGAQQMVEEARRQLG